MKVLSTKKKAHAVALFSGGLDSALAILLMLRQDIEVTALTFMTHFGCDLGDRSSCGSNPYPAAERFGFNVKLMHLGQKFVNIVEKPRFGYGSNMNVCVDCRILMLSEAKAFMEMVKADFLITGEVLGQRPFSQVRNRLGQVEKEAQVHGKLLRPLSAKLLAPTEPEINGLVDREQLEGISGRSRKRQLALAAEFGLEDYPTPASGCLLTDAGYSNRLRDLIQHSDRLSFDDLNLLRVGRHFRLDSSTKLIVGRNEADNRQVLACRRKDHLLLEAPDVGSPMALLVGEKTEGNIMKAAMITARYSSARDEKQVKVVTDFEGRQSDLLVVPADGEEIRAITIR